MESLIVLLLIYLVAVLIAFPLWAIIKIQKNASTIDDLANQLNALARELKKQPAQTAPISLPSPQAAVPAIPAHAVPATITPAPTIVAPLAPVQPPPQPKAVPQPAAVTAPVPPALPPALPPQPAPVAQIPATPKQEPRPIATPPAKPAINWEQFMGVKLFSWLGGFALFLGVAFFIKYSFEHDLIPPEVRVAMGFLLGIGLVAGGVILSRKKYAVTAQTLCASGAVSLYAVTFACRSIYHFEFFSPGATFALMVLITATAITTTVTQARSRRRMMRGLDDLIRERR